MYYNKTDLYEEPQPREAFPKEFPAEVFSNEATEAFPKLLRPTDAFPKLFRVSTPTDSGPTNSDRVISAGVTPNVILKYLSP